MQPMEILKEINCHFCFFGLITNLKVFFYKLHNRETSMSQISTIELVKINRKTGINILFFFLVIEMFENTISKIYLVFIVLFYSFFLMINSYSFLFKIEFKDGSALTFPVKKNQYRRVVLFIKRIVDYSHSFAFDI